MKGKRKQAEIKTRSSLESRTIELLKKNNIPFEYENKSKKLEYTVPATYHKYLPDLIIGDTIYELKGYMDLDTRKKMECVKASNPEQRIVMVFQKDQPIYKGSKTTYTQWAKKVGIECMLVSEFNLLIQTKNV